MCHTITLCDHYLETLHVVEVMMQLTLTSAQSWQHKHDHQVA